MAAFVPMVPSSFVAFPHLPSLFSRLPSLPFLYLHPLTPSSDPGGPTRTQDRRRGPPRDPGRRPGPPDGRTANEECRRDQGADEDHRDTQRTGATTTGRVRQQRGPRGEGQGAPPPFFIILLPFFCY